MKRVKVLSIATLFAVGVVSTACGSSSDNNASSSAPAASSSADSSAGGETSEPSGAVEYEEGPLVVMASSADVNEAMAMDAAFEALTGAKIEWIPSGAPKTLTQLISSKGGAAPADVVMLDTPNQAKAIKAEVIVKDFDRSKLTDSNEFLPDEMYPNGAGPAAKAMRLGTCVNTDELEKAGITLTESIADWYNPALKGHVTLPDIDTYFNVAFLPTWAKQEGVPWDKPAALLDKIKETDPVSYWTSTADVQQSLQSGDIWLSPLHDARCINLIVKGAPVRFDPLDLEVDGKSYEYAGLFDTWDIVANTTKPNLAYAFIDMAEGEDAMRPLMAQFGYLPARTDLVEKFAKDPELEPLMLGYDGPEGLYFPDYDDWFGNYAATWIDEWNRAFKN